MTLNEYLSDNQIRVQTFASRIKVSDPAVYAWLSGRNVPNRRLMARIVAETKGAVTANDFFHASHVGGTMSETRQPVE
jgi:hypothetical protein